MPKRVKKPSKKTPVEVIELRIVRSNGHASTATMKIGFAQPAALRKAGALSLKLLDVMTNG